MQKVIFILPGNEQFKSCLDDNLKGELEIREFPDGESYVRILTPVKGRHVIFICSLNQPDQKIIRLYFLSRIASEQGASKITLVSPYLAYMRQDQIFHQGEGITARYFAEFISGFIDEIITIDPHLHRISSLENIFKSSVTVFQAADKIAEWIKANVKDPVLLGPDSESSQWVKEVAAKAGIRYEILEKQRSGDREVEVSLPKLNQPGGATPILLDDIISTGTTMIRTIEQLKKSGDRPPVCIAIHPVFSGNAYKNLKNTGATVISCNTIQHESNRIDLSGLLKAL